jgi:Zn-dependent membrane protease YugP
VEFDASARALRLLDDTGILARDELGGAKAVLSAAALTYVASAVMAVAQLVRLLVLRNMMGGRDD